MRFKTLVSPLAVVIGLGMTGAAAAQTSIAGHELTEEQIPYIQAYCDDLQEQFERDFSGPSGAGNEDTNADDDGDDTGGDDTDGNDDTNGDDAGGDDTASSDTDGASSSDQLTGASSLAEMPTSMINFDLSALNRDDCIDAGFLTE